MAKSSAMAQRILGMKLKAKATTLPGARGRTKNRSNPVATICSQGRLRFSFIIPFAEGYRRILLLALHDSTNAAILRVLPAAVDPSWQLGRCDTAHIEHAAMKR